MIRKLKGSVRTLLRFSTQGLLRSSSSHGSFGAAKSSAQFGGNWVSTLKHTYQTLDAMPGIAAIAVVLYHLGPLDSPSTWRRGDTLPSIFSSC